MTTRCTPRESQPRAYPPLSREQSELGGIIYESGGSRLRACRIAVPIIPQVKKGIVRIVVGGTLRLAIATWEKGASRVNDCQAIGGSVGGRESPRVGRVRMAIAMTTRCTPRKSQPRAYPPLGNENRASLVGSFTRAGALAFVHVAFKGLSTLS